jgi:hypothetical protein
VRVNPRPFSDASRGRAGISRRWARLVAYVGVAAVVVGVPVVSAVTGAFGGPLQRLEPGRWLSPPSTSSPASSLSVTSAPVAPDSRYLAPGSSGDVWIQIANPNAFPVEITAVTLPSASARASGRLIGSRTGARAGCSGGAPSGVTWRGAMPAAASLHPLARPLVVGPSGSSDEPLIVRLADAAAMAATAPAACESTVFDMPALAGLTTTRPVLPITPSPTTDRWAR